MANGIKIGTNNISGIKIGTADVDAVYIGTTQVYPSTPPFQGKWLATYSGGTTSSAECDSSSAITSGEITKNNLVSVKIGNCVSSIGASAFYNYTSLTSVTIPNSVSSVGNYSFEGDGNLALINIPNSVTNIGISAFYNCLGLANAIIGSGVTTIGNSAFQGCSSLMSVTSMAVTPPSIGSNVFSNSGNCPIYVPSASVNAYKTAWVEYASRIQAIQ